MAARYTFGDSDLAARRLELLASVFRPTSAALMAEALGRRRCLVGDLGCGPGFTTELIADTCQPELTVGIDSSDRYVRMAQSRLGRVEVRFVTHDVTDLPLPDGPFDALYSRLLLTHLPDPRTVVERWRTQVRSGGVLVLEEIEAIDAPAGVFRDYEELVAALVMTEGAGLYPGRLLAALGGDVVPITVDHPLAARVYGMNLAVWHDDAVGRGIVDAGTVDRVARGLAELATEAEAEGAEGGAVRWLVRQLVLDGIG